MNTISINKLERTYNSSIGILHRKKKLIHALRGVSFEVKEGQIYGLLGPNGAGKTTTIKIMSTLLAPTGGEAKILGYDSFKEAHKIREYINVITGSERGLYWRLSAYENLAYFADLYRIPRNKQHKLINELIHLVGLDGRESERVETYSKGMKQKLQIAKGLINNPKIIFMDEPTIGLDPVSAQNLREIIKKLSSEGKTILLTTHYMKEAYDLCNRIAIINNGIIVAEDKPSNLVKLDSDESMLEIKIEAAAEDSFYRLLAANSIQGERQGGDDELLTIAISTETPMELLKLISKFEYPHSIKGVNTRTRTLEDAYISMIKGKEA